MRKGRALSVCLITIFLMIPLQVFANQEAEDLQSRIVERFDLPQLDEGMTWENGSENHPWIVRGSKFISEGFPKYTWVRSWPDSLFRVEPAWVELRSLGIQAAFDRMGYNYLEIIPVDDSRTDDEGNPVERGIPIDGRVKSMDLWVWGSNHDFYLDAHFKDYRGMIHVARVGDLNFRGWKNMKLQIPNSIPQNSTYIYKKLDSIADRPGFQDVTDLRLQLVKLVVWTRPTENVNNFFIYFDHIKVITDTFNSLYDGVLLTDPSLVDEKWTGGLGGITSTDQQGGQ